MKRLLLAGLCLSLCLSTYGNQALAQTEKRTLEDLVESGQLLLRSWIEPADGIVVGEEIQLKGQFVAKFNDHASIAARRNLGLIVTHIFFPSLLRVF